MSRITDIAKTMKSWWNEDDDPYVHRALDEIIRIDQEQAPTIEPKQREWVLCSERLPEEEGEYFVTVKKTAFDTEYDSTGVAYCSPNHKWFNVSNCKVIAWMPLPKPYCGADMRGKDDED